jgi:hypothetical protein
MEGATPPSRARRRRWGACGLLALALPGVSAFVRPPCPYTKGGSISAQAEPYPAFGINVVGGDAGAARCARAPPLYSNRSPQGPHRDPGGNDDHKGHGAVGPRGRAAQMRAEGSLPQEEYHRLRELVNKGNITLARGQTAVQSIVIVASMSEAHAPACPMLCSGLGLQLVQGGGRGDDAFLSTRSCVTIMKQLGGLHRSFGAWCSVLERKVHTIRASFTSNHPVTDRSWGGLGGRHRGVRGDAPEVRGKRRRKGIHASHTAAGAAGSVRGAGLALLGEDGAGRTTGGAAGKESYGTRHGTAISRH